MTGLKLLFVVLHPIYEFLTRTVTSPTAGEVLQIFDPYMPLNVIAGRGLYRVSLL